MGVYYCSREDVKSALDIRETARIDRQIDRLIEGASRSIEGICRRKFYPQKATRYFDWPSRHAGPGWRLWLNQNELISVETLVSGGTTISASDYFLEPSNDGPPYTRLELDLSSSAAFGGGSTHQRSIAITGLFGYNDETETVGTIVEDLDASETGIDVSDSSLIGVGDILKVDSERMIVTGRSYLATGSTLSVSINALANVTSISVTDGTDFATGEHIIIDDEKMLVVEIIGNTLTVRRGVDGTTLASHTSGVTIYAPRLLTVTRGQLGTTAATHSNGAVLYRQLIPGLIRQLCIAETVVALGQEQSGYSRSMGPSEQSRQFSLQGLEDLREHVKIQYARKARIRVV